MARKYRCKAWLCKNWDSFNKLLNKRVCGLMPKPRAFSTALMAASWCPTQQIPQIRLTVCGTSWGGTPLTRFSKKRLASTISSFRFSTLPCSTLIRILPWPSRRVTWSILIRIFFLVIDGFDKEETILWGNIGGELDIITHFVYNIITDEFIIFDKTNYEIYHDYLDKYPVIW